MDSLMKIGENPVASTILLGSKPALDIAQGYQSASMYKAQAQQSELAAKAEELKGRQQADKIRNSLLSTLASQRAGFAARGIQIGTGTPLKLAGESANQASLDLQTAQFGSSYASATELAQAKQYKKAGKMAVYSGYADAASNFYKFGSLIS